ncbi:UPF0696 protein C11orf68 homolog isoform X1 [Stigmatopora argus]
MLTLSRLLVHHLRPKRRNWSTMEEEDGAWASPSEGNTPSSFAAETFAAEALAADMDPWIKFDSRKTPRSEFDDWLESNRPSRVSRYGDEEHGAGVVGWIAVYGPGYSPCDGDVDALQEDWEKLVSSGRPVIFQNIKELALNHGVLSGKWLMHLDTGFKVDRAWECVARATVDGEISSAKVSPYDRGKDDRHVICVYNQDFTDESQVVRLDAAIRASGVKCPLSYKPDVYTYLGIYRKNRWKLCPTIYESKFNLECVPRRSHIINKVTNTDVTPCVADH